MNYSNNTYYTLSHRRRVGTFLRPSLRPGRANLRLNGDHSGSSRRFSRRLVLPWAGTFECGTRRTSSVPRHLGTYSGSPAASRCRADDLSPVGNAPLFPPTPADFGGSFSSRRVLVTINSCHPDDSPRTVDVPERRVVLCHGDVRSTPLTPNGTRRGIFALIRASTSLTRP